MKRLLGISLLTICFYVLIYQLGIENKALKAIVFISFPLILLSIWKGETITPHKIFFDEEVIRSEHPNQLVEEIKWLDIHKIDIMTTDAGPWADDVFWVFHAGEKGCVFPISAEGADDKLFDEIEKRFSGFDNELFISAMGSTSNQHFTVWENQKS